MTTQNMIDAQGPLLDGQLYIGSSTGTAVAANITPGAGISVTNAANAITIAASGAGVAWSTITAATLNAVVENGYVLNHAATPCVVTLPATAPLGSTVIVKGLLGSGGWTMTANGGQTIQFGTVSSTTAGSFSSTDATDSAEFTCIETDTTWDCSNVVSSGLTVA